MRCSIPGFLGVVLVWSLLRPGCRATRDEAPGSPQEEITVYTGLLAEEAKTYLASFQMAYPTIKVNLIRESAGPLIDRMLADRPNPQADVLWGLGVTSLVLLDWHDLLVPYAPAGLTHAQL
jgi:iron(III) transport system substrate-binding protein